MRQKLKRKILSDSSTRPRKARTSSPLTISASPSSSSLSSSDSSCASGCSSPSSLVFKQLSDEVNINVDCEDLVDLVRKMLSSWNAVSRDQVVVKELKGGVTNRTIALRIKSGRASKASALDLPGDQCHIIVRIFGLKTELLISREEELSSLRILHESGRGSPVFGTFKNGVVIGYSAGRSLSDVEIRDPHFAVRIAREMALWHKCVKSPNALAKPEASVGVFPKVKAWIDAVPWNSLSLPGELCDLTLNDVLRSLHLLEERLVHLGSPIVFCHNDLIGGNILYDAATDSIRFIDLEYSCYNFAAHDIADHFNEYGGLAIESSVFPSREQRRMFLCEYLTHFNGFAPQDAEIDELDVVVMKFSLLSDFMWSIWSLCQACFSSIDFDYMEYACKRYARMKSTWKQVFPQDSLVTPLK